MKQQTSYYRRVECTVNLVDWRRHFPYLLLTFHPTSSKLSVVVLLEQLLQSLLEVVSCRVGVVYASKQQQEEQASTKSSADHLSLRLPLYGKHQPCWRRAVANAGRGFTPSRASGLQSTYEYTYIRTDVCCVVNKPFLGGNNNDILPEYQSLCKHDTHIK